MSPSSVDARKYPKVLIVGQTFTKSGGGGITISNLFKDWPRDRLAVATSTYVPNEIDNDVCSNYFQLSYNGKLHPFPLNIFLPRIKHGPIDPAEVFLNFDINASRHKPLRYLTLFGTLKALMDFFGIYSFLYKIKFTHNFREWVKNFDPDIIYSPLNTLEMVRLIYDLHYFTNKPVAIHMWDDWPSYINKPGLLFNYWKKTINHEFRRLINRSSVLLGISESMRVEYKKRYNKDFIPFHNPIEIEKWLPFSKRDWRKKDKFTILYAGRIGIGMKDTIVEFAKVVNDLSSQINDLVFEIQTNMFFVIEDQVQLNDNVKHIQPISYDELPEKFSKVDLLLLPVDFDGESVSLIKYSFQTKISEYMISGTPILVYADKSTEVARFASEAGWAYLLTERNQDNLKKAIKKLYNDEALRRSLGLEAIKIATKKEDARIVREEFRKHLALENGKNRDL